MNARAEKRAAVRQAAASTTRDTDATPLVPLQVIERVAAGVGRLDRPQLHCPTDRREHPGFAEGAPMLVEADRTPTAFAKVPLTRFDPTPKRLAADLVCGEAARRTVAREHLAGDLPSAMRELVRATGALLRGFGCGSYDSVGAACVMLERVEAILDTWYDEQVDDLALERARMIEAAGTVTP